MLDYEEKLEQLVVAQITSLPIRGLPGYYGGDSWRHDVGVGMRRRHWPGDTDSNRTI